MPTLSPSRSRIAVFGGPETPEAALSQLRDTLQLELAATGLNVGPAVQVCVHTGAATAATAATQAVHVNIDLPEIVISPVLNTDTTICLACYQRRRNQHNIDPRLEDAGAMPLVRPRVDGLPITKTATFVLARRILIAVHNWVEGKDNRNEFSLYRTSLNQLSIGRVMPYTGCQCAHQETHEEETKDVVSHG